jgi:hypothetical protein
MQDGAAVNDEATAGERNEVLDPAVRADRRDGRFDVVHPHAVRLERRVVLVVLCLEATKIGVA